MIVCHHLNNSRSQRVLWLLEELGLDYEVKRYERDAATMRAPAALRAVHPLGKSPVITDGDRVIAESGAITAYLVDTYGEGRLIPPADSEERLRYTYWLHFAEGSAMPPLVMTLIFGRLSKPPMPFLLRPIAARIAAGVTQSYLQPQIAAQLDYFEAELGRSRWFAGEDFTAADILMSFPLEAAAARGGLDARRPRLSGFLTTVQARPAYIRALERGGPYSLLR